MRCGSTNDDTAFTSPADVGAAARIAGARRRLEQGPGERAHAGYARPPAALRPLPVPLPMSVRVAHKTGELPNLRHDAGIVFAPGGAYLFVALVQSAASESAARTAIVDLSQGRMELLVDPRTQTEPVAAPRSTGSEPPRLRSELRKRDSDGPVVVDECLGTRIHLRDPIVRAFRAGLPRTGPPRDARRAGSSVRLPSRSGRSTATRSTLEKLQ